MLVKWDRLWALRGDLAGGLTAGLIPVPRAMAMGLLVFAPLGQAYVPVGVVAGLVAMACSNLGASAAGGVPLMNNAPFSLSSIMLLGALEFILLRLGVGAEPHGALILLFFTVALSGVFQILFGLLGIGSLVKYIPYPVLAGLLNGSAILIAFAQVDSFLGLPDSAGWRDAARGLDAVQVATLVVGLSACLGMWLGPRLSGKIPTPIYGIAVGILVYLGLPAAGVQTSQVALVGFIPFTLPEPRYFADFFGLAGSMGGLDMISQLAAIAFGIAAVNSLRSMVVTSAVEALTHERYDANRELIGQGTGNILAGGFGGIGCAGSLSSTLANHRAGGRGVVSRVVGGLFPLLVLLLLHPWVAGIPKVVLAAMLVVIAAESLDRWSLALIKTVRPALAGGDFGPLLDLILVLSVTLAMLVLGIFYALGIGLIIAVALFVIRMGQSPIHRESVGSRQLSNTLRNQAEVELLEQKGYRIRVLELQGSLFFGTADRIAERVEQLLKAGAGFLVLDFRRVTDIDSTAARLVVQLLGRCRNRGTRAYLSGLLSRGESSIHRELVRSLPERDRSAFCFETKEVAAAVAEDGLLDGIIGPDRYEREIDMAQVDALADLSAEEIRRIEPYFSRVGFAEGAAVFEQGEQGDSIYYVVRGRARVMLWLEDGGGKRLRTLCPGTLFGEMAFIDRKPRSAGVVAVGELVCFRMTYPDLQRLNHRHPELAFKILMGLGRELSNRMRISTSAQTDATVFRGVGGVKTAGQG